MDKPRTLMFYLGIIFLIISVFSWGATFILVKLATEIISVDSFISLRFILATVILFAITTISNPRSLKEYKNKKMLYYALFLGTLLYLSFWFQTVGLMSTSPANAAFVTSLNVIVIPIVAFLPPYRRALKKTDIVSVLIAFSGLILVTLDFTNFMINSGDIIILLTAICIGYHVLGTEDAVKLPLLPFVTLQFFVVSAEATFVAVLRNSFWLPIDFSLDPIVWITIVITAVFATAFAFWSQAFAQKQKVRPSQIALIFAFESVFALVIDIFIQIFPSPLDLIGMGLIFLAVSYSIIIHKRAENKAKNIPVLQL